MPCTTSPLQLLLLGYICSISSPTIFLFDLSCSVAATSVVIILDPLVVKKAKMIATALNAIVDRKTVLYAAADASLYAAVPIARIEGLIPGTAERPAGVPAWYAAMKDSTEDDGKPADINAGGTLAGIVCASRLVRMTY
jgi:hypothetical protein